MAFTRNIEKFIPDLKKRKILDLGCGRGDDLIELVKNGYEAVGLDINQEYLNIAENKARGMGVRLELVKSEAEALPFPDSSFDFIIASEVTEHVEDPEKLLSECHRVLCHGGKMYVSFHNRYGPYDHHYHLWFINWMPRRWADFLIKLIGKDKGESRLAGRQKLSEMNYFTHGSAAKLIVKCNFTYLDMREAQVRNPSLSGRKIPKIASTLKLSEPLSFCVKNFIGTFHFILEKK